MPKGKRSVDRGGGLGVVLVLGFGLAAYSQAKLQTVERTRTMDLADKANRHVKTIREKAKRGSIFAADGRPLARDEDAYDLNVDFKNCPRTPAFWLDVSAATGVSAAELEDAAASAVDNRVWSGVVEASERTALTRVARTWRADGISAVWSGRREYPLGAATTGLVGVIRPDGWTIGPKDPGYQQLVEKEGIPKKGYFIRDLLTGLESSQNGQLTGRDGEVKGLTDRFGRLIASRDVVNVAKRKDGENLTLTIDPDLQIAATEAVKRQVEASGAKYGVALVMNPKNGDLLAMANWPSPEPYRPDGTNNSLGESGGNNPCTMSVLEPGSMFKILTLAKAYDVVPQAVNTPVYCNSNWKVIPKARAIHCDDNKAHLLVDDRMAIARSCNIAAGHWALAIGRDPFLQFLADAGLKDASKLGMPRESRSLFPKDDGSPILQTAVVGFGQSINCTPVQLIGAFGAIGNAGERHEPRLVKKIGTQEVPLEEPKHLFSAAAAQRTLSDMEAVMSPIGTGSGLVIPGYRLAGKTGTAQKLGKRQKGHVSNFIGFVPAVEPQAVVLVMVDEPQVRGYHGSQIAGPAFKEIAKAIIRLNHIPPTEPIPVPKSKPNVKVAPTQ